MSINAIFEENAFIDVFGISLNSKYLGLKLYFSVFHTSSMTAQLH